MRRSLHKLFLLSLVATGLQGCVSYYYPAPVIYTDPLADNSNPLSEESGVPSEVLPYTDFGAELASARYYPYWSLDYFYLGYGYGHSSFSVGFGRHYPYHGFGSYYPYYDYYYAPPYRYGWYAPYGHDHYRHHHWNAGYWPYWHHYWRHQYRRHHYAYHPRYHDWPYGRPYRSDTLDPNRSGRRAGEQVREDHEVPRLSTPVVSSGLAWDAPRAGQRSGATPGKTKGAAAKRSYMHASEPGGRSNTKAKTSSPPVRVISRSPGYVSGDPGAKTKPGTSPRQGVSRTQPVKSPGNMPDRAARPATLGNGTLSVVSARPQPAPTLSPVTSGKSKVPVHRTHSAVPQPRPPAVRVNPVPHKPTSYGRAPGRPPTVQVPSQNTSASQNRSPRQLRGATPASSRKGSGSVRTTPPRSRASQGSSDRDR